jgi:hypothetical protein
MSQVDKHKLFIKFLILSILLACLIIFSNSANYALLATFKKSQEQPPSISVQLQRNVPLRISSTVLKSTNALEPELTYTVENISGKSISAYAIRHTVTFGRAASEGVVVRNSDSVASVLQPGQSEQASLEGDAYSEAVRKINLVVDFVEFTDGTTWGGDKFQTAERLAGQRAGAQAESARLLKLEQTKGYAALIDSIKTEKTEITPPSGRSPAWINGFREGINFKRGRLQRANNRAGLNGVINELQQPFDAYSEGREGVKDFV